MPLETRVASSPRIKAAPPAKKVAWRTEPAELKPPATKTLVGTWPRRRSQLLFPALLGCAIFAGGIIYIIAFGGTQKSLAADPTNVTPVSAATVIIAGAPARVEPCSEEILLSFPVSGRLQKIYAQEGAELKAGALLAELENERQQAAVAAAQAELADAEAALARLKAGARADDRELAQLKARTAAVMAEKMERGAREEEKAEARALVEAAKAAAEAAAKNAADMEIAVKGNSRPRRHWEMALDELARARAELKAAEARCEAILAGPRAEEVEMARLEARLAQKEYERVCAPARKEDLNIAEARVAFVRARLREAEATLEETRLRAPLDCRVLFRHKQIGEHAGAPGGDAVFTVGDCSRLFLRAEVDELDVPGIETGMPIRAVLNLPGGQKKSYAGRVAKLGSILTPKRIFTGAAREKTDTRVLEVLLELDDTAGLLPGLRLDVFFEN
jgi:multidrug efflux pump subunit AcrA (membrane-fusion protein)